MSDFNTKLARQRIEENWEDIGACASCGWHALFSEHGVDDSDIEQALSTDGEMELLCQSSDVDDDDRYSHRGVRFNLNNLNHKYKKQS